MNDQHIKENAIAFANKNKKIIAQAFTDKDKYKPEDHPVSVFMAGSPGAGKTESAESLIEKFSDKSAILHIDTDKLRDEFEDYNGENSYLFQGPTSILADRIHDMALKQSQSFVFDGTLSNYSKATENIERSLKRGREVFIVYVYQDPLQAWSFVEARSKRDGRKVPKSAFIEQYFLARRNVNDLKKKFGKDVKIDLICKELDGSTLYYNENIDVIDNYIKERYSEQTLEEKL